MSELKLGDIVKVSKGKFAGKTGHVVGISTYDNNFTDPYYEVYMYCVVPEKYKCRKPLIGNNNVIGGLSADELEVLYSAKSQQQRLIPKDNQCMLQFFLPFPFNFSVVCFLISEQDSC